MKVRKGDKVKVLNGKDKGKTGNVLAVLRKVDKVVVEGVNIVTRFEKKQNDTKKGGLIKSEAPIFACKVQVLNDEGKPSTKKAKKEVKEVTKK